MIGRSLVQSARRSAYGRTAAWFPPVVSRACSTVTLPADSNQALGIAQYAKDFIDGKYGDNIDDHTWLRIQQFHTDSVMTGVSALALKTNAPTILREEALTYADAQGATCFGSSVKCSPEKAIC